MEHSSITSWELELEFRDKKSFKKCLKYLAKQSVYEYSVTPQYMRDNYTTHFIKISSSWTANLAELTKWMNKNISDEIFA